MYFFVPSTHNFSSIFEETPNFWQAQYIAQYVNIFRDKLYQISFHFDIGPAISAIFTIFG